jgi:hypothetical protein
VARPYISPVRVTDQATGSTLTRGVVFVAKWSYTKRYVTDALASCARASWLPRPARTRQRGLPRPARTRQRGWPRAALTDAGIVAQTAVPAPPVPRHPGPSTPRLAAVCRTWRGWAGRRRGLVGASVARPGPGIATVRWPRSPKPSGSSACRCRCVEPSPSHADARALTPVRSTY